MMLKTNKIYCIDALEGLKQLDDNFVDLVLTDPPYGKMWTRGKHGIGVCKKVNEKDETKWDIKPDKKYFDEMMRVSKNQIIFGGNYFTDILPVTNCWLVWDKRDNFSRHEKIPFADCELVWTSFTRTIKKYILLVQGFISNSKDERCHPTQKPTEIISSIIKDFSNKGDLILDPFLGSGTTAVVCKQLHRSFMGFDNNPDYIKIANKRLSKV